MFRSALAEDSSRRRVHRLERLEARCVLAATLSGQVFEDLNGDQIWQATSPEFEPALDCWTVYLDSNRSGELDEGESWKLSAADGSYRFSVTEPGEYAVNVVQQPGFDRTVPIQFETATRLVSGGVQDHVFDPIRSVLYKTAGDRVLRTNPKTNETLAALAFGSSLGAIDITPDGKYLIVGETTTSGGLGTLYKVDLETDAVSPIPFSLAGDEAGVFDLAAVGNTRVLFTTSSSSPTHDPVPLRTVQLTTNTVSVRTEEFGGAVGEVQPDSRLERNSSRSTLLLVEAHDGSGPVHLYQSASDSFVRSASLGGALDDAHLAVSRDGKLIAIQAAGLGLQVFDDQFSPVTTLDPFRGGIAFDSIRDLFYAGDTDQDELVALSTSNWAERDRIAVGEDLPDSGPYYEMQVDSRGSFLSVTTPSGVRYVRLNRPAPHLVAVTADHILANETFGLLDFGNWINGENRRPKASGDTFTIAEDDDFSLAAAGVLVNDHDPDGDTLRAELIDGPHNGTMQLLSDGSFSYSPAADFFGTDQFTYRVHDGQYYSCRAATVTMDVTPVNDAPSDITLSGSSVDENASGAEIGQVHVVDIDPFDQFSFQVSDARFEVFLGTLRLKSGVSLDHEQSPTIDVTITATDTGSPPLSISEAFSISVNDVNEYDPTVETTTLDVAEDGTNVGTVQVRDLDSSQTLDISIVGGNDGGVFTIDSGTGTITVTGGPLDHEGTRIYVITVSVSDNVTPTRTTTADVTITVADVNEHDPQIHTTNLEVAENSPNGTVVGTVAASDEDTSQTLTYSIVGGSGSDVFAIDASTGEMSVADGSQLDREQVSQFVVTVQVTDSGSPARSTTEDVSITVTNVNEFDPQLLNQVALIQENAPDDTHVVTVHAFDFDSVSNLDYTILSGNTDGAFSINLQSGEIKVANSAALNFEVVPEFVLEVQVTDTQSPSRSATGTVRISLTDENEFEPAMSNQTFPVPEDAGAGTVIGSITASDQDAANGITYSIIAGDPTGIFAIDPQTGQITVADEDALAGLSGTEFVLTVQATDNGEPPRSSTATVTIPVVAPNVHAPEANGAVFSLAENSPSGSVVGSVSATDGDAGSTLSYSITAGNANGVFTIDSQSGQITVADAAGLNYESVTQFTLSVLVSDDGIPSKSDEATVTIDLTDVNEFTPGLWDLVITAPENSPNGTVIGELFGQDDDSLQSLTYSISDSAFGIHPVTGVILVADSSQLDFESADLIEVFVTVSDNGSPSKSATAKLTVNLSDVNEFTPVVGNPTFNIDENPTAGTVLGTLTATDGDTGQVLRYELSGGVANSGFAIDATTGVITVADSSSIDAETAPHLLLLVSVHDGGTPARPATSTVTINVQDINEPPEGLSIDSNVVPSGVPGASVGLVSVVDPDIGDQHTISVDDSRFTIDGNHILKVNAGQSIQDAPGTGITLTLSVTDSGGLTTSEQVVVLVTENPFPWHNSPEPLDVNGDGEITPGDVLQVINEINNPRNSDIHGRLPSQRPDIPNLPFYDVNRDGVVSPIDVLLIINEINRRAGNQAEGESAASARSRGSSSSAALIPNHLAGGVSSWASNSRTRPIVRRHDPSDLDETLDELAADIASVWRY